MPLGWYVVQPPTDGSSEITTKKPLISMSGMVPEFGPMAVSLKPYTMQMGGYVPTSGPVAAQIKRLTANFSKQYLSGAVQSSANKLKYASLGQIPFLGILGATAKNPATAMGGIQTHSGSIAAEMKKLQGAQFQAIQNYASTVAAASPKVGMSASGAQVAAAGAIESPKIRTPYSDIKTFLLGHAFAGTERPIGVSDFEYTPGAGERTTVSGGVINCSGPPGPGTYVSYSHWGVPIPSGQNYKSSIVPAGNAGDRGVGPGMCSADGSVAILVNLRGSTGAAGIDTKISGTRTIRATLGGLYGVLNDKISLVPSFNGTYWTYTVYKNDVITALKWDDTGNLLGGPPRHPCGVFLGIGVGATWHGPPGIKSWSAELI